MPFRVDELANIEWGQLRIQISLHQYPPRLQEAQNLHPQRDLQTPMSRSTEHDSADCIGGQAPRAARGTGAQETNGGLRGQATCGGRPDAHLSRGSKTGFVAGGPRLLAPGPRCAPPKTPALSGRLRAHSPERKRTVRIRSRAIWAGTLATFSET